MNITIIQHAKFVLLYEAHQTAIIERGVPRLAVERFENSMKHPAIIELHGIRLTSATPSTAAEAAKINERIDAIYDETLSGMKP